MMLKSGLLIKLLQYINQYHIKSYHHSNKSSEFNKHYLQSISKKDLQKSKNFNFSLVILLLGSNSNQVEII